MSRRLHHVRESVRDWIVSRRRDKAAPASRLGLGSVLRSNSLANGTTLALGVVFLALTIVIMRTWTWPASATIPRLRSDDGQVEEQDLGGIAAAQLPQGTILVAPEGRGVTVLNPHTFEVSRETSASTAGGLGSDQVTNLEADDVGRVLARVKASGLGAALRNPDGTWSSLISPEAIGEDRLSGVVGVLMHEGRLTLLSVNGLVTEYLEEERRLRTVELEQQLPSPVRHVAIGSAGDLWVSAAGSIVHVVPQPGPWKVELVPMPAGHEAAEVVVVDNRLLVRSTRRALFVRMNGVWETILAGRQWDSLGKAKRFRIDEAGGVLWALAESESGVEVGQYSFNVRTWKVAKVFEGSGSELHQDLFFEFWPGHGQAFVARGGVLVRVDGSDLQATVVRHVFDNQTVQSMALGIARLWLVTREVGIADQRRLFSCDLDAWARFGTLEFELQRLSQRRVADSRFVDSVALRDGTFDLVDAGGRLWSHDARLRGFAEPAPLPMPEGVTVRSASGRGGDILLSDDSGKAWLAQDPWSQQPRVTPFLRGRPLAMDPHSSLLLGTGAEFSLVGPKGSLWTHDWLAGWTDTQAVFDINSMLRTGDSAWVARTVSGRLMHRFGDQGAWREVVGEDVEEVFPGVGVVPVRLASGGLGLFDTSRADSNVLARLPAPEEGLIVPPLRAVAAASNGELVVVDGRGVLSYSWPQHRWRRLLRLESNSWRSVKWKQGSMFLDDQGRLVTLRESKVSRVIGEYQDIAADPAGHAVALLRADGSLDGRELPASWPKFPSQDDVEASGLARSATVSGREAVVVDVGGRVHSYDASEAHLRLERRLLRRSIKQVLRGSDGSSYLALESSGALLRVPDDGGQVSVVATATKKPVAQLVDGRTDRSRGPALIRTENGALEQLGSDGVSRVLAGGWAGAQIGVVRAAAILGDELVVSDGDRIHRRLPGRRRFEPAGDVGMPINRFLVDQGRLLGLGPNGIVERTANGTFSRVAVDALADAFVRPPGSEAPGLWGVVRDGGLLALQGARSRRFGGSQVSTAEVVHVYPATTTHGVVLLHADGAASQYDAFVGAFQPLLEAETTWEKHFAHGSDLVLLPKIGQVLVLFGNRLSQQRRGPGLSQLVAADTGSLAGVGADGAVWTYTGRGLWRQAFPASGALTPSDVARTVVTGAGLHVLTRSGDLLLQARGESIARHLRRDVDDIWPVDKAVVERRGSRVGFANRLLTSSSDLVRGNGRRIAGLESDGDQETIWTAGNRRHVEGTFQRQDHTPVDLWWAEKGDDLHLLTPGGELLRYRVRTGEWHEVASSRTDGLTRILGSGSAPALLYGPGRMHDLAIGDIGHVIGPPVQLADGRWAYLNSEGGIWASDGIKSQTLFQAPVSLPPDMVPEPYAVTHAGPLLRASRGIWLASDDGRARQVGPPSAPDATHSVTRDGVTWIKGADGSLWLYRDEEGLTRIGAFASVEVVDGGVIALDPQRNVVRVNTDGEVQSLLGKRDLLVQGDVFQLAVGGPWIRFREGQVSVRTDRRPGAAWLPLIETEFVRWLGARVDGERFSLLLDGADGQSLLRGSWRMSAVALDEVVQLRGGLVSRGDRKMPPIFVAGHAQLEWLVDSLTGDLFGCERVVLGEAKGSLQARWLARRAAGLRVEPVDVALRIAKDGRLDLEIEPGNWVPHASQKIFGDGYWQESVAVSIPADLEVLDARIVKGRLLVRATRDGVGVGLVVEKGLPSIPAEEVKGEQLGPVIARVVDGAISILIGGDVIARLRPGDAVPGLGSKPSVYIVDGELVGLMQWRRSAFGLLPHAVTWPGTGLTRTWDGGFVEFDLSGESRPWRHPREYPRGSFLLAEVDGEGTWFELSNLRSNHASELLCDPAGVTVDCGTSGIWRWDSRSSEWRIGSSDAPGGPMVRAARVGGVLAWDVPEIVRVGGGIPALETAAGVFSIETVAGRVRLGSRVKPDATSWRDSRVGLRVVEDGAVTRVVLGNRSWRFDRERGVAELDDPAQLYLSPTGQLVIATRAGTIVVLTERGKTRPYEGSPEGLRQSTLSVSSSGSFRLRGATVEWRPAADNPWLVLGDPRSGFELSTKVQDLMPFTSGVHLVTHSIVWYLHDGIRTPVNLESGVLSDAHLLLAPQAEGFDTLLVADDGSWSLDRARASAWTGATSSLLDHPLRVSGSFANTRWQSGATAAVRFEVQVEGTWRQSRFMSLAFEHAQIRELSLVGGSVWAVSEVGSRFPLSAGQAGVWGVQSEHVPSELPPVAGLILAPSHHGRWRRSYDGTWQFEMLGVAGRNYLAVDRVESGQLATNVTFLAAGGREASWMWTAAGLVRWGHDGSRALIPSKQSQDALAMAFSNGVPEVRFGRTVLKLSGGQLVAASLENSVLGDELLFCAVVSAGPWRGLRRQSAWTIEARDQTGQWIDAEISARGCWFDGVDESVQARVRGTTVQWRAPGGRWVSRNTASKGPLPNMLKGVRAEVAPHRMIASDDGGIAVDASGGGLPIELRQGWVNPLRVPWDVKGGRLPHDRLRSVSIARVEAGLTFVARTDLGLRTIVTRETGLMQAVQSLPGDATASVLVQEPGRSVLFGRAGQAMLLAPDGLRWKVVDVGSIDVARRANRSRELFEGALRAVSERSGVRLDHRFGGTDWHQLTVDSSGFALDRPQDFFWEEGLHRLFEGRVIALGDSLKGWLAASDVSGAVAQAELVFQNGVPRMAVVKEAQHYVKDAAGRFSESIASPEVWPECLVHQSIHRLPAPSGELRVTVKSGDGSRPLGLHLVDGRWRHEVVRDLVSLVNVASDQEIGVLLATDGGLALRDATDGRLLDLDSTARVDRLEFVDEELLAITRDSAFRLRVEKTIEKVQVAMPNVVVLHSDSVFSVERRVRGDTLQLRLPGVSEASSSLLDEGGRLPGDRVDSVAVVDGHLFTASRRGVLAQEARTPAELRLLGFENLEAGDGDASLAVGQDGILWMSASQAERALLKVDGDVRSLSNSEWRQQTTSRGEHGAWSWEIASDLSPSLKFQLDRGGPPHLLRMVGGAFDIDQGVSVMRTRAGPVALQPCGPRTFFTPDSMGELFVDPTMRGALDGGAVLREGGDAKEWFLAVDRRHAWLWNAGDTRLDLVDYPDDPGVLRSSLLDEGRWQAWRDGADALHLLDRSRDLVLSSGDMLVDGQLAWDHVIAVAASGSDLWVMSACGLERVENGRLRHVRNLVRGRYVSLGSSAEQLVLGDTDGRQWLGSDPNQSALDSVEVPGARYRGQLGEEVLDFDTGRLRLAGDELSLPLEAHRAFAAGSRLWLIGERSIQWIRLEQRWLTRLHSAAGN